MSNHNPDGMSACSPCLAPMRLVGGLTRGFIPSRIALAFVALLLLAGMGRVWDGFSAPIAQPFGLLGSKWDASAQDAANQRLRSGVMGTLGSAAWQSVGEPDSLGASSAMRALRIAHESGVPAVSSPQGYSKVALAIDDARGRGPYEALAECLGRNIYGLIRAVVSLSPGAALNALQAIILEIPVAMADKAPFFTICFTLWTFIVLGLFGSAICRLSAWDFADQRPPQLREAVAWSRLHWRDAVLAPLFPAVVGAIILGLVWIVGRISLLPVLSAVAGIGVGIAMVFTGLGVLALLLAALGFPLMLPSIACDGCDGPEAAQRSGGYVISRPLLSIACAAVAVVLFALGAFASDWFLCNVFDLTVHSMGTEGMRDSIRPLESMIPYRDIQGPAPDVFMGRITAGALGFWRTVTSCLIGATMLSLGLSLATRAYLIMRQACDGQDLSEVEQG